MAKPPADIRFTREHEWIRLDGDIATIGITDHAQEQLGDVVFVELPQAGRKVAKGEACAVVESVKAASDIYAPVSGEVTEANAALGDAPGDVNAEPMGKGWFFKLRLAGKNELDGLMDEAAYDAFVKTLG
jgi:glycine cleavage system H protein